jgi:mannosyltransferase
VTWAVLPPLVLVGVSYLDPIYVFRYVLMCVPAVALLAAIGLDRLPWPALVPVALALAVASVPAHLKERRETSRMDDLRRGAEILRANERPGDAIVFHWGSYRRITAAYPDAFANLTDLSLLKRADGTPNLHGTDTDIATFTERLRGATRVWFQDNYVVPGNRRFDNPLARAKVRLVEHSPEFRLVRRWRYHGGTLSLYERVAS